MVLSGGYVIHVMSCYYNVIIIIIDGPTVSCIAS